MQTLTPGNIIMKKRLKIGFIIDNSEQIPAWYFETIFTIARKTDHELFFIKRNKVISGKPPFLYRLFGRFENYWFRTSFDAAAHQHAWSINGKIPLLSPEWKGEWLVSEKGHQIIKEHQLDLIYTIDYEEDMEENLSEITTYGFWYIRFGQDQLNNRPTGFQEVMSQQIVTESRLMPKKTKRGLPIISWQDKNRTLFSKK